MSRPRPRRAAPHVEARKLDKYGQHRGGRRANAGRKPTGDFGSHNPRPAIDERHPLLVTLRAVPDVGGLRDPEMYAAIRQALHTVIDRVDEFRIVHLGVRTTHIHLLVEANDKESLAKGLRAFQISAAKGINAAYTRIHALARRRRGRVFADRYYTEEVCTVSQARSILVFVLNQWRLDPDDAGGDSLFEGRLDPYASGLAFHGWTEEVPEQARTLPGGYEPPEVSEPRTWLLGAGRARIASISMFETPEPRKTSRLGT